jgi:hypothetical protein
MGLYLCVFDNSEEVEGVEVGPYSDYGALRDYIVAELGDQKAGSKYPVFVLHSDCDGEWSIHDCEKLQAELTAIIAALKQRPAVPFVSDWQKNVAKSIGLKPKNALESFIDVDGEFVLERLLELVRVALNKQMPILFQ